MIKVIAGTTSYLTVSFFDETGAAASPISVSYTVTNLTTGASIRGTTSVTPASTVTIILTAAQDNASPSSDKNYDTRRVTITAVLSGSAQAVSYYDYIVINPVTA